MVKKFIELFSVMGFEPLIWFGALLWLGLSDPQPYSDFTLCPLKNLGIHDCPGCGLGRSISYALHGDLYRSFLTHLLGIPAIFVLLSRTYAIVSNALHYPHSHMHPTH